MLQPGDLQALLNPPKEELLSSVREEDDASVDGVFAQAQEAMNKRMDGKN